MKTHILAKLSLVGLLITALAGLPLSLSAQTNEQPAAVKKEATKAKKQEKTTEKKETKSGEKKQRSLPFTGKLTATDKIAKTITVGERTFQITSTSKIFKAGKPALLEDGVVGELVTGSYKTNEAAKLVANSVYFGGKSAAKSTEKTDEKKVEKKSKETTPAPAK